MLTIGSLFSGIGGLDLGLEWAGLGPVVWQAESDSFKRSILERHWPGVKRYDDVRDIDSRAEQVGLICGGFPCQDISTAGKMAGLSGARSGLWTEFRRIVAQLRPRWAVVENVTGGADLWIDPVREDLEGLGYTSIPIPIEGTWLGSPQGRRRTFVLAHADEDVQPHGPEHAEASGAPEAGREPSWGGGAWHEPDMVRVVHGHASRLDSARRRALGDAVMPQMAEAIGWIIRELEGV
jgi:DNA (cytosine-5)-methyltransferase 1